MKIKKYIEFLESLQIDLSIYGNIDINESFGIFYGALLKSINAEKIDIYDEFKIKDKNFDMNIDDLSKNDDFVNCLSSIGLKKSNLEDSSTYECFINKPCKFMFIYDVNSNELENPLYILFQPENKEVELYKVKDKINNFYNKLSSKTIEIEEDGKKWIYVTSNGNDWDLQNIENENDMFKKSLRKEELEEILKDSKVKITII